MRLDRYLSQAGVLTRSQAQRAVRAREVSVDGAVVTDPSRHVDAAVRIEHKGCAIVLTGARYFMLNKPVDCVCATQDGEHRTVLQLLDVPDRARFHVAGRLDKDATGLVLLTDDGDWSHRVTAPRHEFPKTYRATLAQPLDDAAEAELRRGVQLNNEARRCRPAEIERLPGTQVRITLTEGRYHQVKRMLAAVGNRVVALHRERIGAVALDPNLAEGRSRLLTAKEIASFG